MTPARAASVRRRGEKLGREARDAGGEGNLLGAAVGGSVGARVDWPECLCVGMCPIRDERKWPYTST